LTKFELAKNSLTSLHWLIEVYGVFASIQIWINGMEIFARYFGVEKMLG